MDKEVKVTYEEQTEYRIGKFVMSLVFLALSIVALGVGIGVLNALMPTDVEIDNGIAVFGGMLLMYMWIFVMAVSFVFVFLFSIGGFLCGITSLKRLPNKATKVIAIISTVICGILNVCSMIPAAVSFFAIFSFMITIGL